MLNLHYLYPTGKFLTAVISYAAMLELTARSDFTLFDARITSPALRAVARHWNEARQTRKMPSWSDLNPSALAPYLGMIWAFKYDRSTGDFTARLAGNRMMFGFGKSFRGTPLRELHPPRAFQWVHTGLTRVVSEPACYRSCGPLFKANGRVFEGERIVMPLGTNDNGADGALGASDYTLPHMAAVREIEVLQDAVEWYSL